MVRDVRERTDGIVLDEFDRLFVGHALLLEAFDHLLEVVDDTTVRVYANDCGIVVRVPENCLLFIPPLDEEVSFGVLRFFHMYRVIDGCLGSD